MTRKGELPARTAAPPRSAALHALALVMLLSPASCSQAPGPGRDGSTAESWETLLTTPVRVLLNRHPERGFAGRDLAQAFLGPGAKLTGVLHFETGEKLPSRFLELFDEFQIDLSGLESSFRVSGFGLKAGSTLRFIADRVIPDDLEVKVLAIYGIRKDGSKEQLYPR